MAMPYVGEIRMFAGNFAPNGWLFCDGRLLPISEYNDLFRLLGTDYGGDGRETFALPDLRGRIPVHQGNGLMLAETGGAEEVTLTVDQIPGHSHMWLASGDVATSNEPSDNLLAQTTGSTVFPYGTDQPPTTLHPATVSPVGGGQPHNNLQPYLCVNLIISLFGIFPSPT